MRAVRKQPKAARPRKPAPPKASSLESFARLDRSAIIFLVFAFCAIHWLIRLMTSPVYTVEEADALLLSQSLQVGYEARQPPLLSWLFALVGLAGAPPTPAVFAIKYSLFFVALVFYYLSARNVLVRPAVSAAAAASWMLTFQVGWGMHEDGLHAVALMAALSLALHAATRLLTWRRRRDCLYFGLAIGLGLLTHHLFAVFIVALLIAIFLSPFFREALRPAMLVTTLIVAALVYAPYGFWVATHIDSVSDAAREFAASWEIDNAWFARARNGAGSLGLNLLLFTLPLSLFWAMLFWPLWLPAIYPIFARRSTDEEPHETAWRRLLARVVVVGALLYVIGVLLGVQVYKSYWMLPVLFTAPIWMFAHVKRAGDFPVAIRGFAAIVIILVLGVMAGRFVESRIEILTCDEPCRPYTPVRAWADELKRSGFMEGTIVGADEHLTGNLRGAFPRSRVLDASKPPSAFPPPRSRGACLAVWRDFSFDEEHKVALMPPELERYLTNELATPPRDPGAEGAIRRDLRSSTEKAATIYFQFVPPSESCR